MNACLSCFTHTFIPFTHPIVHTPSLPHYSAQTYTVEKKDTHEKTIQVVVHFL